jgi:predicted DNA-binding transcriptional regulator AlpA
MKDQPMVTTTNEGSLPQYARAKKAAAHFQISVSSLWSWVKNRDNFPKPLRAGRRTTLFDIGAIDAFLKSDGGGEK